jgi:hypothetical protein
MVAKLNPRMYRAEPLRRCRLDECRAACCLHGAWTDQVEARDILAAADTIAAYLPQDQANPQDWFDGRQEPDSFSLSGRVEHTTVICAPEHYGETACIFLRLDDHKCALQVAATAAGLHKWRYKPFYCILHPLDFDETGWITLDETEILQAEPGSCLRPTPKMTPLTETFAEELTYLLGNRKFRPGD